MLSLVVLTSASFTVFTYQSQKRALLQGIDRELLTAALFTRALLPADYHDRITGPSSVPEARYRSIVERFDRLCDALHLQYVWSVLRVDGQIVFTSGTATSKDIRNGDYARFYEVHSDPQAFDRALATMRVDYSSFNNKWGHGRQVLVPARDARGRPYIFGASINLSDVDALLSQTLYRSLLVSFAILLLGVVACYLLANSLTRPIAQLTGIARRIADGDMVPACHVTGSAELLSLSQSIAEMSASIRAQLDELHAGREDLHVTLDSIGDGVIATDMQGNVTRLNRVAQQLTGWSAAEAIGQPLSAIFHIVNPQTREPIINPVAQIMADGQMIATANDTLLIARNGVERQIADSAAPIRLCDEGPMLGTVLVFRDVTDQYQFETRMRQTQKMESIGRLAGGIAHDFNNMLCGITGYAGMLADKLGPDAELNKYVRPIQEAANRAATLTRKLLAYSRQGKITFVPIDVHRIIKETLSLLERTIDKYLIVEVDLAARMTTIAGDPTEVQHALLNLCLNARDAMLHGGSLSIVTDNLAVDDSICRAYAIDLPPGDYLRVRVTDTGSGIPAHLREKIFDPFFTTKDADLGTGLGLAGVYTTVHEHHGAVSVQSELGLGTTFTLWFPVITDAVAVPAPPMTAECPGAGVTILFVDDEPIICELGAMILTDLGYHVLLAQNGHDALALYQAQWPTIDLVILDVIMPQLNGPDTFRQIRALNPAAKVLFASGYTHDTSVEELLSAEDVDFIAKPYNAHTLHQAVRNALRASAPTA